MAILKNTKLEKGIFLIETKKGFSIETRYWDSYIRKRYAVAVPKQEDAAVMSRAINEAVSEVRGVYERGELRSVIGTVIKDEVYSIKGIAFTGARISKKTGQVTFTVNFADQDGVKKSRSVNDYERFVVVWNEAISSLMAINNIKIKPIEWRSPPTKKFFDRMRNKMLERS